jgi:hypothetical protein
MRRMSNTAIRNELRAAATRFADDLVKALSGVGTPLRKTPRAAASPAQPKAKPKRVARKPKEVATGGKARSGKKMSATNAAWLEKIPALIAKQGRPVSVSDLSALTRKPKQQLKYLVARLLREGVLAKRGDRRSAAYVVASKRRAASKASEAPSASAAAPAPVEAPASAPAASDGSAYSSPIVDAAIDRALTPHEESPSELQTAPAAATGATTH